MNKYSKSIYSAQFLWERLKSIDRMIRLCHLAKPIGKPKLVGTRFKTTCYYYSTEKLNLTYTVLYDSLIEFKCSLQADRRR